MAYDKNKRTDAQKAAFYGSIEMPKKPRVKRYGGKSDLIHRETLISCEDQRLLDEFNESDPMNPVSMKEYLDLMK